MGENERIYRIMLSMEKFEFESISLETSDMSWNSKGLGQIKTEVIENKIIFNETIELHEEFGDTELKDKKMWVFYEDKIEFWHLRNGSYQKIFTFLTDQEKIVLEKKYDCKPDVYLGGLILLEDRLIFTIEIQNSNINIHHENHRKKEKMAKRFKKIISFVYIPHLVGDAPRTSTVQAYLAAHSSFFHAMFFGPLSGRTKTSEEEKSGFESCENSVR